MINALRDSVRPLCTLLFAVAIVAGFFTDRIGGEVFIGVSGSTIAYWYIQREKTNADQRASDQSES